MQARDLVYPLFVPRTTWFGKPVCSAKGEWVEHGFECHEIRDSINVQVSFTLEETTMGHINLLLSKAAREDHLTTQLTRLAA